ncbi:ATP-dependent dethiobiotin synthetase BioD [Kribbella capetownensis]|uniref:ATP-dependent dethiobiotin synthetase BioD n=1 Tax=Kribbella capetownensis TaxID=1572659 RepID=A0A4R0J4G3_9ACTN|nr:dethiobiotin synthase [Kribbella capetownensis]TCC39146.1 ATP-dependent dethiobiotin synthetase BioD [Kribbella capetownensis]
MHRRPRRDRPGLVIILVTGTDTEVGKTIATAALAARATGTVAVVKPAQTGVGPDEPGDLAEVRRLTGLTELHEGIRLRDPLAPTTAARRARVPLPSVESQAKSIDDLARSHDSVLVEGAGGLLVGLDGDGNDLSDLATHLTAPFTFVVVARSGLGTLNHTGLTVEALRSRNLPIDGLIIGSWPAEPDLAEQCNLEDLPVTTGVPVIGRIPAGAGRLDREAFLAAAPGWFG